MEFEEDLKNSIKVLREGGVILYPTDTIWGLGCDATNAKAVEKIFSIKARDDSKSLIVLVDGVAMLERYVDIVPEVVYELIDVSDSPLTIVYPSGKNFAPAVLGSDGSVGIRVCNDHFCSELIKRFRKPLVSTSANISGEPAPLTFSDVDTKIVDSVDYAVSHRRSDDTRHSPSPIIKVDRNGVIRIIRS
jgi:L-threonylcarbamoyladenylate synthase